MSNSTHWFNIQGCLEKYRDISSSRAWLLRASRELDGDQFSNLVNSINSWLLQNTSYHDLAEELFHLLSEFDPIVDEVRRAQFDEALRQALAWQRAREEFERINALRRQTEDRERLRLEQILKREEASNSKFKTAISRRSLR
jgi:hypothetical protein